MATEQTRQIVLVRIQVGVTSFQAAVEASQLTSVLIKDMTEQCEGIVVPVDEDTVYDFVKRLWTTAKGAGQTASVVA